MHFASRRQLVALVLLWTALLVGYDHHKNPKSLGGYWMEFLGAATRPATSTPGDRPHLKLWMPHLCCSGCLSDVRTALEPLRGLGTPQVAATPKSVASADEAPKGGEYANQVDVDVTDLGGLDFLAIDRAMRDVGLVPDKVELSGLGHFRLEVEVPHMCCKQCSNAIDEQLERQLRSVEQGRWLDSLTVNKMQKTVVIYARMNAVVDLADVTTALGREGLAPRSIRATSGPES